MNLTPQEQRIYNGLKALTAFASHSDIAVSNGKASGDFLVKFLKHFSHRKGGDVNSLQIDFLKKRIIHTSYLESHHNGDLYGEKQADIDWSHIEALEKPILRELVNYEYNKKEAIRIAQEKEILKDQILLKLDTPP